MRRKILQFLDDLKLYALIFGIWISRFIPDFVLDGLMLIAAFIWYRTDEYRRKAVENNLRIILGEDFDRRLVWNTFKNYMLNFTDVLKVKHRSCRDILRKVPVDGLEKIEKFRNTGFVLLTGHIGNWELGASLPGCLGFDAMAVVENIDPRWLRVLNDIRGHTGLKLVPIGKSTPVIVKYLSEGKVVIVATDRYVGGKHFMEVEMFGRRRKIPTGIFQINEKMRKPMVFAYVVREDRGYRGIIQDVFEGPFDMKSMVDFYIRNMEKAVKKYPDQYYSFDFNWK